MPCRLVAAARALLANRQSPARVASRKRLHAVLQMDNAAVLEKNSKSKKKKRRMKAKSAGEVLKLIDLVKKSSFEVVALKNGFSLKGGKKSGYLDVVRLFYFSPTFLFYVRLLFYLLRRYLL